RSMSDELPVAIHGARLSCVFEEGLRLDHLDYAGGWQMHGKRASARRGSLDADRTTHQSDQSAANRQPQSVTLAALAIRIVQLSELVKNPLSIFGRDSNPSVLYAEPYITCLVEARADADRSLVCVLDRVHDEIGQRPSELAFVGTQTDCLLHWLGAQEQPLFLRQREENSALLA